MAHDPFKDLDKLALLTAQLVDSPVEVALRHQQQMVEKPAAAGRIDLPNLKGLGDVGDLASKFVLPKIPDEVLTLSAVADPMIAGRLDDLAKAVSAAGTIDIPKLDGLNNFSDIVGKFAMPTIPDHVLKTLNAAMEFKLPEIPPGVLAGLSAAIGSLPDALLKTVDFSGPRFRDIASGVASVQLNPGVIEQFSAWSHASSSLADQLAGLETWSTGLDNKVFAKHLKRLVRKAKSDDAPATRADVEAFASSVDATIAAAKTPEERAIAKYVAKFLFAYVLGKALDPFWNKASAAIVAAWDKVPDAIHLLLTLLVVAGSSQPALPPVTPPPPPALMLPPPLRTVVPRDAQDDWQVRLPEILRKAGPKAARRTLDFFAAEIRNPNTRQAYMRAVGRFFGWCDDRGVELADITPLVVASYIEELQRDFSAPTVKQHLAAIRMLFDYLVVGQVLPMNPASSVRGPKHVVKRGKTPVLTADQARQLLDSIDTSDVIGLRDRALIGVMVFTFARVSATTGMRVEDYFPTGKRWWFRLHEKGGKRHEVPAHHHAEAYVDAYLGAAGIGHDKKGPLFRTLGRDRALTRNRMDRADVLRMVYRRAKAAGLDVHACCHTFRATGITAYLENGGTIEKAQQIAAHESPRTTKLYDRTNDELTLDEIERIAI